MNYVIFHDKSIKQIEEGEYRKIVQVFDDPEVPTLIISGSLYSKSSVSKVLSESEFSKQYPGKLRELKGLRGSDYLLNAPDSQIDKYLPRSKSKHKKAIKGMLKGLDQFINNNGGLDKMNEDTQALRKRMTNKLLALERK